MPDRPTPAAQSLLAMDEREVRADEAELELSLLEAQLRGRERQLQATRTALIHRGESVALREQTLQKWALQAGDAGLRLAAQLTAAGTALEQTDEEGVLAHVSALVEGRDALLQQREEWLQRRREQLQRRQEALLVGERGMPRVEMTLAMRERRLTQTSARLERLLGDPNTALALPELPGASLPGLALAGAARPSTALANTVLPNAALPNAALPSPPLPGAALPGGALPSVGLADAARRDATPDRSTVSTRRLTGMPVFRPAEAPAGAADAHSRAAVSGGATPEALPTEIDLTVTPQARVLVDPQSWVDPRHAETWTIPRPGADTESRPVVARRKTTPISSDVWSKLLESSGGSRRKGRRSGFASTTQAGVRARLSGVDESQFVRLEGLEIPRARIEFDRPTQVLLISVAGERPMLADRSVMAWEDRGEWIELPLHIRRVMPEGQQTWVVMAAADGWSELDLDRWEAALGKG